MDDDKSISVNIHNDTNGTSTSTSTPTHTSSPSNDIILQSEEFQCRGDPAHVSVTSQGVTIVSGGDTLYLPFADMIGVVLREGRSISLHSYPYTSPSCYGKPHRVHKPVHIRAKDEHIANRWHDTLTRALNGEKYQQRKILVLLNPVSGTGRSIRRWQEVEPMFKQSAAFYELIHTTHAGHAYEITNGLELTKYDSIVCVSGDGLLSEAFNGLMNRPDWQVAVRTIRFGLIMSGSGNGLAHSILYSHHKQFEHGLIETTFLVLKGRQRYLDVFCVAQPQARPFFGFLSFSWGFISDSDLESDDYRWCGPLRFSIAALALIVSLRRYQGVLSLLKADVELQPIGHERGYPKYDVCTMGSGSCQTCAEHNDQTHVDELATYLEHIRSFTGSSETWTKEDYDEIKQGSVTFPTSALGDEEKWEDVQDDFITLWGMNVTHAGADLYPAPIAHFADGYMDLVFMGSETTRCKMLGLFSDIDNNGEHVKSSILQYAKVKAFRLTPASKRHSPIDVDGEQIKYAPCEVRLFKGVLQLLC